MLVMAGGTGGHVFPALAVASELRARGVSIEWLGTAAGIESELVPKNGFTLHTIDIVGLRGKRITTWLKMPWLLLRAVLQARRVIKKTAPKVVLGLGGFASGPGGLAAKLCGIPLIIHEQNAVAGTTNKWLSKMTPYRLEAFPNALPKAQCVGNPIRNDIIGIRSKEKNVVTRCNLLVLGGSLGARAINRLIPELVKNWSGDVALNVWHQTGKQGLPETNAVYIATLDAQRLATVKVEAFIDDMAAAYRWADLVICRAGALTVSEVAAAGVAAIFIPYPYAIDDHQTKNAGWLVKADAAKSFQEKDLTADVLIAELKMLLQQPQALNDMGVRARAIAPLDAVNKVADLCVEVARG